MKLRDGALMMSLVMEPPSDQVEVDAEVIVSVLKLHELLLEVGVFVLLKLLELSELLKFPSLQDLQHI